MLFCHFIYQQPRKCVLDGFLHFFIAAACIAPG